MSKEAAEPMVRFENVSKRYGPLTVLDGLDLAIGRREKVAIIGPSGSGKSTLLNIIGGLDRATSGDISIDGHSLAGLSDDRRRISWASTGEIVSLP